MRPARGQVGISVLKIFSEKGRVAEVMPIIAPVFLVGSVLAAIAWWAEAAAGVAEEAHRATDDIIFSIPLLVIFILTVRTPDPNIKTASLSLTSTQTTS